MTDLPAVGWSPGASPRGVAIPGVSYPPGVGCPPDAGEDGVRHPAFGGPGVSPPGMNLLGLSAPGVNSPRVSHQLVGEPGVNLPWVSLLGVTPLAVHDEGESVPGTAAGPCGPCGPYGPAPSGHGHGPSRSARSVLPGWTWR